MAAIEVRPATLEDAPVLAGLLAARHARDAARLPALETGLAEPEGAAQVTGGLLTNPRAQIMVAEANGRPVGFLAGEKMMLPPTDMASLYIPPHSISIGIEGHAVDGAAALDVYRALYAALAREWVDEGFFTHRIAIPAGDAELQEAWVTLGFGRYLTAAVRPTAAPVPVGKTRNLTIERASPEDIDDVVALADDLNAWHWESPMFWPVLHMAEPAHREFNVGALRGGDAPYFVAYEDGRPVGMQTFLRPGFTPPIVKQDTNVYLFEGVVANDVRGGGIGAALLSHSMEWAARSGYTTCTLHFAPGNPSGAPFWLGHGFVPVEHTMERTVDSRVAWARPKHPA